MARSSKSPSRSPEPRRREEGRPFAPAARREFRLSMRAAAANGAVPPPLKGAFRHGARAVRPLPDRRAPQPHSSPPSTQAAAAIHIHLSKSRRARLFAAPTS